MTNLSIRGVAGGYDSSEEIVRGIDLDVQAGEFAVIVGPNGAGKSTFLKMVAGLVKPRRGAIAVVPQEKNVFGSLTVRENLQLGCYTKPSIFEEALATQLARFPSLGPMLSKRAMSLSGGQRQIVALAIALMACPSILLLDEPTAGLSPGAAKDALATISELARSGLAVLMVEQNALIALHAAQRGVVLAAGQKIRDQSAESLSADPEIRALFLGRH
jgi:branched-chain amino acid transport system ATP-binding protein